MIESAALGTRLRPTRRLARLPQGVQIRGSVRVFDQPDRFHIQRARSNKRLGASRPEFGTSQRNTRRGLRLNLYGLHAGNGIRVQEVENGSRATS